MGLFDQCCNCNIKASDFSILREFGGFPEYAITHSTDNPLTYFLGRRYQTATRTQNFTWSGSITCDAGGVVTRTGWDGGCQNNFSNASIAHYSDLVNIPSINGSGTICDGSAAVASWQEDGYLSAATLPLVFYSSFLNGTACAPNDITNTDGSLTQHLPFEISDGSGGFCDQPPFPPSAVDYDTVRFEYNGAGWQANVGAPTGSSLTVTGNGDCACQILRSYISNPPPVAPQPWYLTQVTYAESVTIQLTNEVNYNDNNGVLGVGSVVGTVMSAIAGIIGLSAPGQTGYGFNDAPWPSPTNAGDFSHYDGSLVNSGYVNAGFTGGLHSAAYYNFNAVAGAAFFIVENHVGYTDVVDTGEIDPETGLEGEEFVVEQPYILATFILMNDGSKILDTFNTGKPPCVDGTETVLFNIPVPSPQGLPPALYGTDGEGNLTGPIGRITFVIPRTTCATWDGTLPS